MILVGLQVSAAVRRGHSTRREIASDDVRLHTCKKGRRILSNAWGGRGCADVLRGVQSWRRAREETQQVAVIWGDQ